MWSGRDHPALYSAPKIGGAQSPGVVMEASFVSYVALCPIRPVQYNISLPGIQWFSLELKRKPGLETRLSERFSSYLARSQARRPPRSRRRMKIKIKAPTNATTMVARLRPVT
jgi:hypothetical protein